MFTRMPSLTDRLQLALAEDIGQRGDVTSQALTPADKMAQATLLAKADGVLCGVELLAPIFTLAEKIVCGPRVKKTMRVKILKKNGARVKKRDEAAIIYGNARALLAGERVALNLLCHLSGIATQTAQYAAAIAHTRAKIFDTRKTTPLWRDLEKYAVARGGGENHRRGLYDMILIKDNHLALWGTNDPAGAVNAAQAKFPDLPIEIEVINLAGLERVCEYSAPDFVLLDNFSLEDLRVAVNWRKKFFARQRKEKKKKPLLEASGGVTLETLPAIAETGVERISIGALTHSARALDLSLEFQ